MSIPQPYHVSIDIYDKSDHSHEHHQFFYMSLKDTFEEVEKEVRSSMVRLPWQEITINVQDVFLDVEYSPELEGCHEAPF
ncbi:hypothetical protein SAMN05192534_12312 [Alteribacillus persepolensis]|uniref:Uncharacterized protein n=1 Tax=Alteribacillus persepolensis TaxID=568899 RepID=A0A1G8I699_9BACI|nr:hypothetical protein [Alteribacillus persepolensis]SDI14485.1 hypothetical protein SAMN05192534_12312 [Alteribacillus persepolensis]